MKKYANCRCVCSLHEKHLKYTENNVAKQCQAFQEPSHWSRVRELSHKNCSLNRPHLARRRVTGQWPAYMYTLRNKEDTNVYSCCGATAILKKILKMFRIFYFIPYCYYSFFNKVPRQVLGLNLLILFFWKF